MPQLALPSLEAVVVLNPCEAPPPVPVVTTEAPVREHQPLYLSAREFLYAVNAADGTARWCQQVMLTGPGRLHHSRINSPAPPQMHVAMPQVVDGANGINGVVYVCIDGWVSYTCAFTADD